MPRTAWLPMSIALLCLAGGGKAQSGSEDAKLAWGVGHQIGALHDASYYNDRNGAIQNLQNIITLMRLRSCLDPAPWAGFLKRLQAGATARSLFDEIIALERVPDGPVVNMVGRCLCQCQTGNTNPQPPHPPQPPQPPQIPPGSNGFAGFWITTWGDWGRITLMVSGNRITGYYGGDGTRAGAAGTLEGTFEGRVAKLRWKDKDPRLWGGCMFTLSADGNSLSGHRNDWKEPEVAMYRWDARRDTARR